MSPFAVQILADKLDFLYEGDIWIPLLGIESPEQALVEMRQCTQTRAGRVRLVEVDEQGTIVRVLWEERHDGSRDELTLPE